MRKQTAHRVAGVGKQTPPDPDRPFNPEAFEQAIHGLQALVVDVSRLDDHIDVQNDDSDDYTPSHTLDTDEDGQKVIHIDEDSLLYDVMRLIPNKWNVSVLTDLKYDNSFAVRASVDCGGEILVWATLITREGMFGKLNIGYTCLEDPREPIEITDFDGYESSRSIMHVNRYLEREVIKGYASVIDSAARAFDFIGTKTDVIPRGSTPPRTHDHRERHNQKDWSIIRDKTQQTVSDNVRASRKQLYNLPDSPAFDTVNPSLIELDPDDEDSGDIRLV